MRATRLLIVAFGPLCALLSLGCQELPEALHRAPLAPPTFTVGATAETTLFSGALWDDGNAEVARFSARQMRYGEIRDGELILITVTEPFDPMLLVKADGPVHARAIDAVKLNTLLTFQTGVYTYRQMTSAFVTREALRPIKLVASSQEWCGTTSTFLSIRGSTGILRSFSYFGAEAEGALVLALPDDVVLEDALPLWLRALDFEEQTRTITLVPSQLSNHSGPSAPVPATVTIADPETLEVPAGVFDVRAIEVAWLDRTDVYHLEVSPPHAIVRIARAEHVYERTLLERAPYWRMNGTEHVDALLPPEMPEMAAEAPDASE